MHYVYGFYSEVDHPIYIGTTSNLKYRLPEHGSGKAKSAKAYFPWHLFYSEKMGTKDQARIREKYFKSV